MIKSTLFLLVLFGVLLFGCTQTQQPAASGGGTPPALSPSASTAQPTGLTLEQQLSVCSGMPPIPGRSGASFEDACIAGLAGKHKDSSLCKSVASELRGVCYALVAIMKNDAGVCSEAGGEASQCYTQYAKATQDSSVCEKLDVYSKDNCYMDLANNLGDASLCTKIKNLNQKDSCYSNMAMRFGDASYCSNIVSSNQKQLCEQNLQR